MGKGSKRRKQSTDVDGALSVNNAKKHKQKKRSEIKVEGSFAVKKTTKQKLKLKQRISENKQMNKIIKSLKAMNETLDKLLEKISVRIETAKSDLPQTSLKEKETPKKKVVSRYPCCYETEDAKGPNFAAVFVTGIDTSLERDDIKSALIKHFGSCGVTRVFVPFDCATGVPTGYAFVNVEDKEKALTLSGSYMGGCKLEVMITKHMVEYIGKNCGGGCDRCRKAAINARIDRFYQKHCPPPPGFLEARRKDEEALEARSKDEEALSD